MTSWDGARSVRLTSNKSSEDTPRWSPDGRYLTFLSDRDDPREVDQVWLLDRVGRGSRADHRLAGRRVGLRLVAGQQAAGPDRQRSRSRLHRRSGGHKPKGHAPAHRREPVSSSRRTRPSTSIAAGITSISSIWPTVKPRFSRRVSTTRRGPRGRPTAVRSPLSASAGPSSIAPTTGTSTSWKPVPARRRGSSRPSRVRTWIPSGAAARPPGARTASSWRTCKADRSS